MKKRQGARGGTHQSEGFWEKRHRQDISSHRNHAEVGGRVRGSGGRVQVPAPATPTQLEPSANGGETGRAVVVVGGWWARERVRGREGQGGRGDRRNTKQGPPPKKKNGEKNKTRKKATIEDCQSSIKRCFVVWAANKWILFLVRFKGT